MEAEHDDFVQGRLPRRALIDAEPLREICAGSASLMSVEESTCTSAGFVVSGRGPDGRRSSSNALLIMRCTFLNAAIIFLSIFSMFLSNGTEADRNSTKRLRIALSLHTMQMMSEMNR